MSHSVIPESRRRALLVAMMSLILVVTGSTQGAAAAVSDPTISTARTVTFSNDPNFACSTVSQSVILTAISDAITYAQAADAYFDNGYRGARYITWFGAYDATRWSAVATRMSAIHNSLDGENLLFKCVQPPASGDCGPGVFGYIQPTVAYVYNLCGEFFNRPATGTDSRAGTLVHFTSQFNAVAGAQSYAFGQSAAQALAISNPANAALNADNIEYFAENNPAIAVAVTSVAVSPTSASMYVGESTSLTVSVTPTNADNQNLVWTSSDASIATVSSSGLVSGLAEGASTITATSVDGSHVGTSTVTVAVRPPAPNPPAAPASTPAPTPTPSPSATTATEPSAQPTVAPETATPVASMPTAQRWTQSRIRAMRAPEIRALTAGDVAAMRPRVFAAFRVSQLGYLRPTVVLSLRPAHIQALSTAQIGALGLVPRTRLLSQAQRLAVARVLRVR